MKNVNPLNVLALALLTFSIGIFATTQLMPIFAADPTTFFSCETGGGGCAIRLNTTTHIILNSTGTVHYPTNGTYSLGSGLNMTEGFVSFHQHRITDFDVGAVHSIVLEDTGRDGEARFMLLGGTIAAVQTTTLHFMPRFDDAANFETLSISGDGTNYRIDVMQAGTGSARPLIIEMDGVNILTFETDNDANFNTNDVLNLGHVDNDFSSVNTLTSTNFLAAPQILTTDARLFFNDAGEVDPAGEFNIKSNNDLFILDGRNAADNAFEQIVTFERIADGGSVSWQSVANHIGFNLGADMAVADFDLDEVNAITQSGSNDLDLFLRPASAAFCIKMNTWNVAASDTLRSCLGSNANTVNLTYSATNLIPIANNTLNIGFDDKRWADIYAVVSHQKSLDTGLILESEYEPNPFEVFNNGDVVCLKDWKTFTKCNIVYNRVLGPVYFLRENGIVRTENITKYRLIPETEIVSVNITDKEGNTFEVKQEIEKTKIITEPLDIILKNDLPFQIMINKTVTSFINSSYTDSIDVYGIIGYKIVIVVEGPYRVKVCLPVNAGQLLIAGSNGCAIGVDSYSDIPPLMFPIGYAALDSKGGYVEAVIL